MTKQILFPAIVESVASRKDKTLSIKIGSNELPPDRASQEDRRRKRKMAGRKQR